MNLMSVDIGWLLKNKLIENSAVLAEDMNAQIIATDNRQTAVISAEEFTYYQGKRDQVAHDTIGRFGEPGSYWFLADPEVEHVPGHPEESLYTMTIWPYTPSDIDAIINKQYVPVYAKQ